MGQQVVSLYEKHGTYGDDLSVSGPRRLLFLSSPARIFSSKTVRWRGTYLSFFRLYSWGPQWANPTRLTFGNPSGTGTIC
jgi:hypothetical protein